MYQTQSYRRRDLTFQTQLSVPMHISNMWSSLWSPWNKCVCEGLGIGGVLAQLNVSRTQKLFSNAHVFCQGQGQMLMCLLGQTGTTGAKAAVCSQLWLKTGSLNCVVNACITWIPRGSIGSLSKHKNLGGSTGLVVGRLEVADTRRMPCTSVQDSCLRRKEEGWVSSRRGWDVGLRYTSVSKSRGLDAGGMVPRDL